MALQWLHVLAYQPQGRQLPSCGDHRGGCDGDESEGMSEDWRVCIVCLRVPGWSGGIGKIV